MGANKWPEEFGLTSAKKMAELLEKIDNEITVILANDITDCRRRLWGLQLYIRKELEKLT